MKFNFPMKSMALVALRSTKSWTGVRHFALVFLLAAAPLSAPAGLCGRLLEADTTIGNFATRADAMNLALAALVRASKHDAVSDWGVVLKATKTIMEHVHQNTIQHGSDLMNTNQWMATRVPVSASVFARDGYVYAAVRNRRIKPFPKSLEWEFFTGEHINVPRAERAGYVGSGIAHRYIFLALEALPKGSSVQWYSDETSVTFLLKLRVEKAAPFPAPEFDLELPAVGTPVERVAEPATVRRRWWQWW
ncbi:MAG: hypothetical protein ABL958_02440 [Bdellovibrionia bacterium]